MGFLKNIVKGAIGIIPGGQLLGAHQAQKNAKREAEMMRAEQGRQEQLVRNEQAKINERLAQAQAKANMGVARQNRGRMKGGIFGDANGPDVNQRLG